MLKRRCPFVGLCGDPDTVVAFASLRNCCNRVEDPSPIRLAYQHSHCFTFEHRRCEVLLQETPPSELPSSLAANPTRRRAAIIVGSVASFILVGVFGVVLFGGWQPAEATDQNQSDQYYAESTIDPAQQTLPDTPSPTAVPEQNAEILLPVVGAEPTNTLLPTLTATEPKVATATVLPTAIPTTCGAPAGWGLYIVRAGDTLSSIAAAQGVTVAQLQNANCLTTAAVYVGQRLYVPHPNPITPVPTWTAIVQPSATATLIHTPLPSDTPEPTLAPTATDEPTQEPTLAPTTEPTLEPTPTEVLPSPTNTPILRPSDTPVPPPTDLPAPTATPTPISLPVTPEP